MEQLLGGMDAQTFLRDYWQKQPLLVRNAIPGFTGLLDPQQLLRLTRRENVVSRLVRNDASGWHLRHGPLRQRDFPSQQAAGVWTVLVQEINYHLRSAEDLLQRFRFIPHARLDDLMVSYAVAGGGVGPHFDSYDVFLVQGIGHRRWQIGAQTDLSLVEGLPLKILRHFVVEQEWVLGPGDMLYLPPCYAHNGIAEDECMTYSIGFRAPAVQEIAHQFLVYLQDRLDLPGVYQDPDLQLQAHPAELGEAMLCQFAEMVGQIHWEREDIDDFAARYLTEPKAHVYFRPPARVPGFSRFCSTLVRRGLRLAPQSRMLFSHERYYLNGERVHLEGASACLRRLADERAIAAEGLSANCLEWLYQCFVDGYVVWDRPQTG